MCEIETLADSGHRKHFESGAVRDARPGVGRCDLLPFDVIKRLVGPGDDLILESIGAYKDTGDPGHLEDAVREALDMLFPDTFTGLLELAQHFEAGAIKYGDSNWELGIPVHCYLDSATRHYLKYLRGDEDERHDRALLWNLVCATWTHDRYPELRDSHTRGPSVRGRVHGTYRDDEFGVALEEGDIGGYV